ncbi:hypothetical protein AMAG_03607 [Allomyces macrogynus ATCC 38327]|uniref:Uncharacterized protein n=1 Tax=Allomyces macrogynus (strain ATCC 38327) TaxID=578462 RepID=A0A0L0SA38_ALLM3|nr:hypothetical protein AMAG_03607 [Allomyces macrogynus ATCC 38327]|eukprot:KNE59302.1 hypothetical protein AMAG_03607 [Allomyces macrogynus ATCC 38327]
MANHLGTDTQLLLSRASGLITCIPALMTTVEAVNCVLYQYRGRPLQRAILGSAVLSIAVDIVILVSVLGWLANPDEFPITAALVAINLGKRLHSIVTVHLTYLRSTAVNNARRNRGRLAAMGHGVYGWVAAYTTTDWDSVRARDSDLFKYGYRVFNVLAVLYYAVLAVYTDVSLLGVARTNPLLAKRFEHVRQFLNIRILLTYELVMLIVVVATLLVGIANPSVTASVYAEQLLLALITLNAALTVKAAASIPGDSLSWPSSSARNAGAASTAGRNAQWTGPAVTSCGGGAVAGVTSAPGTPNTIVAPAIMQMTAISKAPTLPAISVPPALTATPVLSASTRISPATAAGPADHDSCAADTVALLGSEPHRRPGQP